jgi:GTP-binding protein
MRWLGGGMLVGTLLGDSESDDIAGALSRLNLRRTRPDPRYRSPSTMHFIDECEIRIEAGDGGDGAVAFRREKFVPFGGPAGGDGGRGGDVIFVVDPGMGTLFDLQHQRVLRAQSGENGGGRDCYGAAGKDLLVRVPPGTIVFDAETGARLHELTDNNQREIVAHAGKGGRGNKHFATSVERAPRRAEPGTAGEKKLVRLELKVMADVGLLGFPNVGKSTFIRAVSRARPKVAEYPFTTLEPHLGVVSAGDLDSESRSFVVADIPGLIPGASRGLGLGIRFLKHVERTRLLLHLVTLSDEPDREPLEDYRKLRHELAEFSTELAARTEVVALSKADLPDVREAYPALRERFAAQGVELHLVSSASHAGLDELVLLLSRTLAQAAKPP